MIRTLIALAVVLALGAVPQQTPPPASSQQKPQRPTFYGNTSLVTVEVSVLSGNKLVRDLVAGDFQIFDNKVAQKVEVVDVESLPVDVTLVVDVSGSVMYMIEELQLYTREVAASLRVDDRFRLVTFSSAVNDRFGLRPATEIPPIEEIKVEGATSIFDALTAALMRTRRADRRQIVIGLTDGYETASAIDGEALKTVAKRSDSVLHVLLVRAPMMDPTRMVSYPANSRRWWLPNIDIDFEELGDAAHATGGEMQELNVRKQIPTFIRQTLEDFRTSYVLRYTPTGVAADGWHDLEVKVRGGPYKVRARPGYFVKAK